jgi:hypothetical protein
VPTQLQLEGPDLESLLARVKSELGPTARIVRAEKVRTGGIAGFFATQRFEISVEIGEEPVEPVDAPLSLLDLADKVSSNEHLELSLRRTGESPVAAGVPAPAPAPAEAEQPRPDTTGAVSFAAVLAGLDTSSGTGPTAIPRLEAAAPTAVDAHVEDRTVPDRSGVLEPSSTHVSTEGSGFAGLMAHLDATAGTAFRGSSTSGTARPSTPAVPQFLEPAAAGSVVVTIPAARTPDTVRPSVARPVDPPFGRSSGSSTVNGQLARLGLPAHLQPHGSDDAVRATLLESLRSLPEAPAPANRAGTVLAVVGPLPQALEAARALARDLGIAPASAVVLAASRRTMTDLPERQVLRDLDQAEQRRAGWRRRRNTTIVAIEAPMTAAGAVQARAYLSVLDASATWGAVEATRKPLDVGAFARAVGGFDALALSAVDETSDPAAVLELGIPVARLGGQPATPSAWAALLTGRLAA